MTEPAAGSDEAGTVADRADALRKDGRYSEGIRLIESALASAAHDDDKADLWFRLGNLRFDQGNLDDAEEAYLSALDIDPDHANAMHNLAVVYKRRGQVDRFVRTYKKAQRLTIRGRRKGRTKTGNRPPRRLFYYILTGCVLAFLAWVFWGR